MRTLRMFLVALCGVAMLTGTSSCKKENVGNVAPGEEMHIRASVGGTGGNAKTHLVQEGNQFKVAWDSWDAFALYAEDFTQGSRFRFDKLVGDGTTADFVGYCPGEGPYYAGYPYDIVSCSTFGTIEFAIPARQSGNPAEQSESVNAGPMVGYLASQTSGMTFKNVMSWLKVGLMGDALITRVVLTDKGGNKLNGKLIVTYTPDGFTCQMDDASGTNQLEIVSEEGIQLTDEYKDFWFQVPAGSLGSLNLSAYAGVGGSVEVLSLDKTITHGEEPGIAANTIATANVSEEVTEIPEALPGLFTVASGKKVGFSRGNLVATINESGAPTVWKFARHQYDYLGAGGANLTIGTAAGDVDLFCWSTNATNNNWGIFPKKSQRGY